MSDLESRIRSISDTARWVAVYRARETERKDAVFRDPFARRLAGERGEQIAASMSFAEKNSWPFVTRTWLIDHVISNQVKLGTDMVVNLAAGLDARPYRMNLPGSLRWIEVDLPEILAHKEVVLRNERSGWIYPMCAAAANSSQRWDARQIGRWLLVRVYSSTSTKKKSHHLARTLPLPRAFSTGSLIWLRPRS